MAQGKVNREHDLVRRAMEFSMDNNVFHKGSQMFKEWIDTHKPSKVNKALSDNKQKLIGDIETYTSKNPDVFSAGCFEREVLSNLNEKQLKAISTFVSKIDYLYEHSASVGDPYLASQNKELGNIYKSAIEEMSPYFEGVNLSRMFGADTIKSDIEQLNSNIPTSSDLELVEAFKRIGVDLSLHINNSNVEWRYEKPQVTSTFDDMFRFKESEVKAFTQGYLNQSIADRKGKVITPEGLMKVYRERGLQLITDRRNGGQLNENDKNMLLADFENKCKGLTTKDNDWEIGLLTNQEYIVKMSQSLALQEIAHDALDGYSKGSVIDRISQFQDRLDENKLYNASRDKRNILNRLGNECVNCSDTIHDSMWSSELPDVENRYDRLISTLETRQRSLIDGVADPTTLGRIESQIEALKVSKENLLMNVEFLKNFTMKDTQLTDKKQIVQNLQFASGRYWVNSNEGEFEVVDRHSGVINGPIGDSANKQKAKDALVEAIKASVLAKAKSGQMDTTDLDESAEESVEEMYESGLLTYLIENKDGALGFADSMNAMYKLKVSEILFEEGNPFDTLAEEYFAQNPNKSFDDFVSEQLPMADEKEGLFDRRSLRTAYEQRQVEKGEKDKLSDASAQHIKSANEKYGESIVLLDRVLNALSPEELEKFHDPTTPSSAKSALINTKVNEAKKQTISATKGNKEYESAMAKYNNSVLSNLLSTHMDLLKSPQNGMSSDSVVAQILQKYIDQLTPSTDTQQSQESQPSVQKDQYVTYGDLRQKTVDLVKFEKAMKGFSSKELKKRFIKPLLAGLKGKTKLNISAYERKKQAMRGNTMPGDPSHRNATNAPLDNDMSDREVDDPLNNNQNQNDNANNDNNSNTNNNVGNTTQNINKKNLKKRELDASAFLPALCMIDKAIGDVVATEGPTSSKVGGLNNLKYVFQCLTSIDNLGSVAYSQPIGDGTDFRDACRNIAFDICKGVLKDPKDVQDKVSQTIDTYNIPKDSFSDSLVKGFSNLTPELMNFLFEFSSDRRVEMNADGKKVNKLTLGSKLPRGLDACKTDQERMNLVKKYMENNLANYDECSKLLDEFVNDIYLGNNSSSGYGRIGDEMEFDEM